MTSEGRAATAAAAVCRDGGVVLSLPLYWYLVAESPFVVFSGRVLSSVTVCLAKPAVPWVAVKS